MNRRNLLKTLGGVGGMATLAACNFGEDDPTETSGDGPSDGKEGTPDGIPHASEYSRVVNVVEAGANPEGEEPIDAVLDREANDDTLLYFPPGSYRLANAWQVNEFSNLGLVGWGATFRPPPEGMEVVFAVGQPGSASDFLFEGFEFDFRGVQQTPRPLIAKVDDGLVVRDVSVTGPSRVFRFDVASENGSGRVERLRLTQSPENFFAVGCLVTPLSEGKLTFEDCHIENFPNNGLYASPSKGPVHVVGGKYVNNGISNVRVGENSLVRDVTVRCDTENDRFSNMRGIWARKGANVRIENCDLQLGNGISSDGAIVMAGRGSVRKTTIEVDADGVNAILVDTNAEDGDRRNSSRDSVTFEDVRITGNAANQTAIRISNRDNCIFRGLRVHQTGQNRNGLSLFRSHDNVVRDASITVSGMPIVIDESTVEKANVLTESTWKPLPR